MFNNPFIQVIYLKKEETMQLVQTLPPQFKGVAKYPYEQFLQEGIEKGMEEGFKQGMEEAIESMIRNLMSNRPTFTDEEIADMFGLHLSLVVQVRKKL